MVNLLEEPEERFAWVYSRIELRVLGSQCPEDPDSALSVGADAVIAAGFRKAGGTSGMILCILRSPRFLCFRTTATFQKCILLRLGEGQTCISGLISG